MAEAEETLSLRYEGGYLKEISSCVMFAVPWRKEWKRKERGEDEEDESEGVGGK